MDFHRILDPDFPYLRIHQVILIEKKQQTDPIPTRSLWLDSVRLKGDLALAYLLMRLDPLPENYLKAFSMISPEWVKELVSFRNEWVMENPESSRIEGNQVIRYSLVCPEREYCSLNSPPFSLSRWESWIETPGRTYVRRYLRAGDVL